MATKTRKPALPAVHLDPSGELHGIPTFPWRQAPDGLATRRQLAAKGLRIGGQPVAAQIRLRGWIYAYLYRFDLAKPQFKLTPAKLAAVRTAARSRQRCDECERVDLGYIPRQGEPAFGRCWTCMGLPEREPDPDAMRCPDCAGSAEVPCRHCGEGIEEPARSCAPCRGQGLVPCTRCQGL